MCVCVCVCVCACVCVCTHVYLIDRKRSFIVFYRRLHVLYTEI